MGGKKKTGKTKKGRKQTPKLKKKRPLAIAPLGGGAWLQPTHSTRRFPRRVRPFGSPPWCGARPRAPPPPAAADPAEASSLASARSEPTKQRKNPGKDRRRDRMDREEFEENVAWNKKDEKLRRCISSGDMESN